jgi:coenzyme F420-0:L-glutamate ligase / coenzyme F420-1:gamma-L-glutamate ligase
MTNDRELRVLPVHGLPEIVEGAKLGELIAARTDLVDGDVVVIAQKVVSKAEGRVRRLADMKPDEEAHRLAAELDKDPALVQVILEESREVLRAERGVLIAETHHGFVCANAGIDSSNLPDEGTVCLLPLDPDASARNIRREVTSVIAEEPGVRLAGHSPSAEAHPRLPSTTTIAIVIADSFGRAWRLGQAEVAIGCAGLRPLDDWRGRLDAHGRKLEATQIAVADEAAGAADLVRDKNSGIPAVVIRGLDRHVTAEDGPGAVVIRRPRDEDLFR